MISSAAKSAYAELDDTARHVFQIYAMSHDSMPTQEIAKVSNASGWTNRQGRPLSQTEVNPLVKKLLKAKLLLGSQYYPSPDPDVLDWVVQESIRQNSFDTLSRAIQKQRPDSYSYYGSGKVRDMRIAFYRGDVDEFKSIAQYARRDVGAHLLDPFSRDIFDRLDPILQDMYLLDAAPKVILDPAKANAELMAAFDHRISTHDRPSTELVSCWLDLAVVRGRLDQLQRIDELTQKKFPEVAGCEALLRGDLARAEQCFAQAMPIALKKIRLGKLSHAHWPSLLYLLLLIKQGTAAALVGAKALARAASRNSPELYKLPREVAGLAIAFRETPTSPALFFQRLYTFCSSPLPTLLAGYISRWLLEEDDAKLPASNLVSIANAYRAAGLDWLAAEAAGLAGKSKLAAAEAQTEKHLKTHALLGTSSLVDLIQPEPAWQRSLTAMANMASNQTPAPEAAATRPSQRLIWEINHSQGYLGLQPILQKHTSKGWSTGKRVGLARLREKFTTPEFSFLTEPDLALCRAIEVSVDRGYHGYSETNYFFDAERSARALVGHPCVYRVGEREQPLEIVEQPPRLVVVKQNKNVIRLKLDPTPDPPNYGQEDFPLKVVEDGPRRLIIVFFSEQHHKLHRILGNTLDVPAAAAERVLPSLQAVSSLVAVHSEIGGDLPAAETVAGDPRPHVHLLPHQEGLRVEFFVRPFGDEGLFQRTGQGSPNVFATIGGLPKSARRKFKEEKQALAELLEACPELAEQNDDGAVIFPSPAEALEALMQLEDYLAAKRASARQGEPDAVALHWPQGQSLQLAGRASASQLQVQIRKDRDWFAASGTLKVDRELSVDMLRLIELVEASPSRFVKLDDGRFLALTDQLRQRIADMASGGERRDSKLRFPGVRAAAWEDMGDVQLKADTHWQECVQRMRSAANVRPQVPTTLQTELRDYQLEGFQWLARLAAWGVGGCLADDMGLGKTIEALTLLLHRAAGGPALVVAPTSVAFNWLNEAARFGPTLQARLFGPGDRQAFLQDLGPRDVVITSYGLLHSEAERFQAQTWHTVILDEAQAIKNMATRRSQAAMGLQADFRMIMTGTPLENHLGELWNLFQFINPGLLGSLESFQQRFSVPIERDHCPDTRRRLKKLIQPFLLRRTKTQVLSELPPRTELVLQVEMSDEEAAFYEALRQRAIAKLSEPTEGAQHIRILAEIMRLRRACCHPKLALPDCGLPSAKLALFSSTIDELLDNHHKALVFSQFVDHLTILREELDRKGIKYQYLDGSTSAKDRKQRVEAFQSGEGDVFLISLKAGGLGLNLTAADYVLHMDPWWNPAVEDQASDRAHRMGQQRPVTIYRFITKGTIEERITEMHVSKRDLADSLLEGADISGKLTAQQLLKLIRD